MINQMKTILLRKENIVFLFFVDSWIRFVSGSAGDPLGDRTMT